MIAIYGASDDLVEIEAEGPYGDEIGCFDDSVTIEVGDRQSGGLRVVMEYATARADAAGVWSAAVSPLDEDVPIPWPVRVVLAERGYSPVVEIDCPSDTKIGARRGESGGPMFPVPSDSYGEG